MSLANFGSKFFFVPHNGVAYVLVEQMINTYYIYYGKDRRQDNDKTKRAITTKILITTKPTKTTSRVQAQC